MIICVLKSGGVYDAQWVRKLRDGVSRHLSGHRFVCLSDVEVPCDKIPLQHDWPGWWSKLEIFRPGVITEPTLYLDLDTVITGPLKQFMDLPYDFAMLGNFHNKDMVGSGVMWFKAPMTNVYERFAQNPQQIIDHYQRVKIGAYRGDQAFIFDCLEGNIDKIVSPALRSYKMHCRNGLPEGTAIVAFHGRPRPTEINPPWLAENWI